MKCGPVRNVFVVVACLLLVVWGILAWWPRTVEGTFCYWFKGYEKPVLEWSGPDPIWSFDEDMWKSRPADFNERVWTRYRSARGERAAERSDFERTQKTLAFRHTMESFTYGRMSAASRDRALAADVVNASMEEFVVLSGELLRKRRECAVRHLKELIERLEKDIPRHPESVAAAERKDKAKLEKELADEQSGSTLHGPEFTIIRRAE